MLFCKLRHQFWGAHFWHELCDCRGIRYTTLEKSTLGTESAVMTKSDKALAIAENPFSSNLVEGFSK
eukprot:6190090-Amphidinium_carterae.1